MASERVAFSCKDRGFCPACCERRMVQTALHLVDEATPLRQWVLSFPFPVRYRLAYDSRLCSAVRRIFNIFMRALLGWLRETRRELASPPAARARSSSRSASGTAVQNAGERTRTDLRTTTIVLRVHPWYGETVAVLRGYGGGSVWIEREDGDLRIVPISWTALRPRRSSLQVDGEPVHLSAEAALALASWVVARLETRQDPRDG